MPLNSLPPGVKPIPLPANARRTYLYIKIKLVLNQTYFRLLLSLGKKLADNRTRKYKINFPLAVKHFFLFQRWRRGNSAKCKLARKWWKYRRLLWPKLKLRRWRRKASWKWRYNKCRTQLSYFNWFKVIFCHFYQQNCDLKCRFVFLIQPRI